MLAFSGEICDFLYGWGNLADGKSYEHNNIDEPAILLGGGFTVGAEQ